MTGIAVSVQRLDRISPSRWSGQLAISQTKEVRLASAGPWREGGSGDRHEVRRALEDERRCHAWPPVRFSAATIYFLRSLRFQQAVSDAAFSLVIGIRVVYIDPFTDPGF